MRRRPWPAAVHHQVSIWNGGHCRPSTSVKPHSVASCPTVSTRPDFAMTDEEFKKYAVFLDYGLMAREHAGWVKRWEQEIQPLLRG